MALSATAAASVARKSRGMLNKIGQIGEINAKDKNGNENAVLQVHGVATT